jgi:hypothetical protein
LRDLASRIPDFQRHGIYRLLPEVVSRITVATDREERRGDRSYPTRQELMRIAARLALLCLSTALCFAGSWPGYLLDSKCYEAVERNRSPLDNGSDVDRDRSFQVRYCHPTNKTRTFVFMQQDGLDFGLDDAGNAKAAELVRGVGKKAASLLTITGEKSGRVIQVKSISLLP